MLSLSLSRSFQPWPKCSHEKCICEFPFELMKIHEKSSNPLKTSAILTVKSWSWTYPHNWNNHSLSKDTLETLIVLFHRSHIAFLMSIMQWLWVLSKMLTYIHLYLFSSLRYDFNMPAGSYGNLVGSCFQEKKIQQHTKKKVKQWQGSFLTYTFLPSWRLWIPGVNLFVLTCNLKCQCL